MRSRLLILFIFFLSRSLFADDFDIASGYYTNDGKFAIPRSASVYCLSDCSFIKVKKRTFVLKGLIGNKQDIISIMESYTNLKKVKTEKQEPKEENNEKIIGQKPESSESQDWSQFKIPYPQDGQAIIYSPGANLNILLKKECFKSCNVKIFRGKQLLFSANANIGDIPLFTYKLTNQSYGELKIVYSDGELMYPSKVYLFLKGKIKLDEALRKYSTVDFLKAIE